MFKLCFGKIVGGSTYFSILAIGYMPESIKLLVERELTIIPDYERDKINVIRIDNISNKITYLSYSAFSKSPFPALIFSIKLQENTISYHKKDFFGYQNPHSPP